MEVKINLHNGVNLKREMKILQQTITRPLSILRFVFLKLFETLRDGRFVTRENLTVTHTHFKLYLRKDLKNHRDLV